MRAHCFYFRSRDVTYVTPSPTIYFGTPPFKSKKSKLHVNTSNADNVNSITSGYTLNTASCSSLLHILILVLSVPPVQHSSICHSRRMVRRLRVEKLPENVSVSPSRGSCRRNAHSRLRQDPSGVAARRGSGSLRPYVAPTSTEGARNRRVMELFQLPGSSGRGGPAGSRPRAAVGPCLPVAHPSTGNASCLEGLSLLLRLHVAP